MKILQDYISKARKSASQRRLFLAQFIDDFRRLKDLKMLSRPVKKKDRVALLFVATAHQLALDLSLRPPEWLTKCTPLKSPYFVSKIEGLKLLALRDSPYAFRARNIYVLGNFLSRY